LSTTTAQALALDLLAGNAQQPRQLAGVRCQDCGAARPVARGELGEAPGVGAQRVRVEHQRQRCALRDAPRQLERSRTAPEPRAERQRASTLSGPQHVLDALGAERAVLVRQVPRHQLGWRTGHHEPLLGARNARGDVARAGAHRGQRAHARSARQAARAADHEHVTAGELRRGGVAPWEAVEDGGVE
jgi:hypothetical protein